MAENFVMNLRKLFESPSNLESKYDAACVLAGKAAEASSATILLYSEKEEKLRCIGRFIDPIIGAPKTHDELLDVIKNICACRFLFNMAHPPDLSDSRNLYRQFNKSLLIENSTTEEKFAKLIETYQEWNHLYESLIDQYQKEIFPIGTDTDTVTGPWYKQLRLKNQDVPQDSLIKRLDEVEEVKKFYCLTNLENELNLSFDAKYYVALPLYANRRHLGVLRFLYPGSHHFIDTESDGLTLEPDVKERLQDVAHSLSLYLEIHYFSVRLENRRATIYRFHDDISNLLKSETLNSREYLDSFFKVISKAIKNLGMFPDHKIWEYISDTLPENASFKERIFLRDISTNTYHSPNFTKEEFISRISGYYDGGKFEKIFPLPGHDIDSPYFNLPIFTRESKDKENQEPVLVLTLMYKEENSEQICSEDFFKSLKFFANQVSLGWDMLLDKLADIVHKRIETEINNIKEKKNPSGEDEINIITRVFAEEFQADWCAFFLANEQKNTLRLEFSNLDLQHHVTYKIGSDTEIPVTCFNNKTFYRLIGNELISKNPTITNSLKLDSEKTKIEHIICCPIIIGKIKSGVITLARVGSHTAVRPKGPFGWNAPPFSPSLTYLVNKVQRHVFDIILSYFSAQQRLKYMQNVIGQIIAPIKSSLGPIEEVLKGKVRQDKYLRNLHQIKKLSLMSLNYASNFEKKLELDSQEIKPNREVLYDLRDYLIGISMEYQPLIKKKCISIRVTNQTPNTINVFVDKDLFQRAIGNIVDNTVKYSFDPEERRKYGFQKKPSSNESIENVLITAKENEDKIIITISSLGLEIKGDEKEKIFDNEFRGSIAKERLPKATGIGLYISQKIVESHEGVISLEDTEEKYQTVIRLELPKIEKDG